MSSGPSQAQHRPQRIGVLFVHGIGEQTRGDTLLSFGEPLFRWLCRWLSEGRIGKNLTDPRLWETNLTRPISDQQYTPALTHLDLEFSDSHDTRRKVEWLMAESWWAQDFTPPSPGQLARWALGIGPWAVWRQVRHLFDRSRQASNALFANDASEIQNPLLQIVFTMVERLNTKIKVPMVGFLLTLPIRLVTFIFLILRAFFQLMLGCLMMYLVQLLTIVLLIPAWIPVLSSFVQGAQRLLANSIGDSYILVTSPLRFNAMITQIQSDLDWLARKNCDQIVVIAHSQGAAVAYEALAHSAQPNVDLLVTFGSGLSKLKAIQEVLPYENRLLFNGGCSLVGATCVLIGALSWLSALLPFTLPLLSSLSATVANTLIGIGLILIGYAVAAIWNVPRQAFRAADLRIRSVGQPGGMEWQDFYSSSDPVPDGPLPPHALEKVASHRVYNQASWLKDHSLYWDNQEQFVARIAQMLSERSGWYWSPAELSAITNTAARRASRVSGLMLARSVCLVSLLIAAIEQVNPWLRPIGALLRSGSGIAAALLPDALEGFARTLVPNSNLWLGRLGVLLLIVAWYMTIHAAWSFWDTQEAQQMFARKQSRRGSAPLPFFLVATTPPLLGSFVWLWVAWSQGSLIWQGLALASIALIVCGVSFGWGGLNVPIMTEPAAGNNPQQDHPPVDAAGENRLRSRQMGVDDSELEMIQPS
jgi:pimeloyl-ACP methyl ester carboxylesterase